MIHPNEPLATLALSLVNAILLALWFQHSDGF